MTWYPHVTVATVVENDGKFLIVKETSENGIVYNQPAGHLELGENLIEAAIRETREETAWQVEINHLIGVQHFRSENNGITYIRFSFAATPVKHFDGQKLDDGIISAHWLTLKKIESCRDDLRSPMVLNDIRSYLSGAMYPLDVICTLST